MRYEITVYDLNDPLTVEIDLKNLFAPSRDGRVQYDFGVASGPHLLDSVRNVLSVGRQTNNNYPDIVVNHPQVSRRQGILTFRDGNVFYQDSGLNKPRPEFRGKDVLSRNSALRNNREFALRHGEGLVFADSLEMVLEKVSG